MITSHNNDKVHFSQLTLTESALVCLLTVKCFTVKALDLHMQAVSFQE